MITSLCRRTPTTIRCPEDRPMYSGPFKVRPGPAWPALAATWRQTLTLGRQPLPRCPPPPFFPGPLFSSKLPYPFLFFGYTVKRAPRQATGCPVNRRELRTMVLSHWQALFGAGAIIAEEGGRAVLRLRASL